MSCILFYKIKPFLCLTFFISCIFCLILESIVNPVFSSEILPYFEFSKHGRINWFSGTVQAQGMCNSTILAQDEQFVQEILFREAKIRATAHLLDTLLELHLNNQKRIHDLVKGNKSLNFDIRGLLHLARVSDKQMVNKGKMKVTLTRNLYKFSRVILPDSFWYEAQNSKKAKLLPPSQKTGELQPYQFYLQPVPLYTGLIVDAKRVGGEPALICKIFDKSNKLIYGPSKVFPKIAQEKGMARYVEDLGSAKNCRRIIGDNPLIVQAQKVRGENRCDYVIASNKLDLLLRSNPKTKIFKQCRVVIVLGPSDPSELVEYSLD
ncbi:MAG TPA: hypothetical protein VKN82_03140 [Desulfohalobiaceae bacterium]|nr:hypothetical protein [Desulfohalobiaceae bacterium]